MRRPRYSRTTQETNDTITVAAATAQLTQMLTMARSIDQFTVDSLSRMYRVPKKVIADKLAYEQARRASR